MSRSYQRQYSQQEENQVQDALEDYVREGARQMLASVLEEEVNAFLGRHRYARSRQFRGYRNGYHQARELTVGLAAVEVRVPRVSQRTPGGGTPGVSLAGSGALPEGLSNYPAAVCPSLPFGKLRAGSGRAGHRRL